MKRIAFHLSMWFLMWSAFVDKSPHGLNAVLFVTWAISLVSLASLSDASIKTLAKGPCESSFPARVLQLVMLVLLVHNGNVATALAWGAGWLVRSVAMRLARDLKEGAAT